MVYIYALVDPRYDRIRYVGKTNNPARRLSAHIWDLDKSNPHKKNWLISLHKAGLRPEMVILEECIDDIWQDRERYWIAVYREIYPDLLNVSDGGDSPCGESARQMWRDNFVYRIAKQRGLRTRRCRGCGHITVAYSGLCKKCVDTAAENKKPAWLKFYLKSYEDERNSDRVFDEHEICKGMADIGY